MSEFLADISTFNTDILIPFIEDFFTNNLGFLFVGMACLCVVIKLLASLINTKF